MIRRLIKRALPRLKEFMQPEDGIESFVEDETPLVYASDKSKTGYCVPELVINYGSSMPKFKLKTMLTIMSTIKNARQSYKEVSNNPTDFKTKAPEEFIEELVQYAESIAALDLGFTEVKPEFVFKNSTILHENAVVITKEMEETEIEKAPSKATGHEVHKTYRDLGIIVNQIARFLRTNGYSAQAGPALGGTANYTLLAEKAGLGAIGNHGLLISPEVGPRQRIAVVYTSITNLPIKEDNDHLWIKEFCKECRKCVRDCPSQAIYEEPKDDIYDTERHIDYKQCAESFADLYGCSICIKECPFNQLGYAKLKNNFLSS